MAFFGPKRLTILKFCIALSTLCVFIILARINDSPLIESSSNLANDILNSTSKSKNKPIELLDSFSLVSTRKDQNTSNETIDLLFIFTRAHEVKFLEQKFSRCLKSLFKRTHSTLHLHVITDIKSLLQAKQVIRFAAFKTSAPNVKADLYNVERIVEPLRETVTFLQPHFSYKPGAYYSDALFFLSVAIHNVFPQKKLLMIDIDTKLLADIKDLYRNFNSFQSDAVMGLAYEQQPVYFHLLRDYRLKHKETKAGGYSSNGSYPGFNSGVMLLHLERMRNSTLYNSFINATAVDQLAKEYQFKGHLGDQDFFTLLSFKHPQLFYVLPCCWNRQLCQWWKHHGYKDVFDKYYQCNKPVKLFHGNCNSPMPEETEYYP